GGPRLLLLHAARERRGARLERLLALVERGGAAVRVLPAPRERLLEVCEPRLAGADALLLDLERAQSVDRPRAELQVALLELVAPLRERPLEREELLLLRGERAFPLAELRDGLRRRLGRRRRRLPALLLAPG